LHQLSEVKNADCLLFLVAHDEFRQLTMEQLEKMYHPSSRGKRVIVDVKSMFSREALEHAGYVYWNL
jgi:UDP-N-acetyl-D-galactosamine dehydrogenase